MTHLTLFACPKPFHGHTGVIQRNAIRSWQQLDPQPEILLVGDDEGVAEVAAELGVTHLPGVATTEQGTPRVDSIFAMAKARATATTLAYINADIILLDDFSQALQKLSETESPRSFLLCCKRIDIECEEHLEFSSADWATEIRRRVREEGVAMNHDAIDAFVFSRDLYDNLLPLALGRTAWDNYLLFQARASGAIVINASDCCSLVHQAHDYGHVGWQNAWQGPEAIRNRELVGDSLMTILEAGTHILGPNGLTEGRLEHEYDRAVLGLQRLDLALKELRRQQPESAEDFLLDALHWLRAEPGEKQAYRDQMLKLETQVRELQHETRMLQGASDTASEATPHTGEVSRQRYDHALREHEALANKVRDLETENEALRSSLSWRLTGPLRSAGRLFSRESE